MKSSKLQLKIKNLLRPDIYKVIIAVLLYVVIYQSLVICEPVARLARDPIKDSIDYYYPCGSLSSILINSDPELTMFVYLLFFYVIYSVVYFTYFSLLKPVLRKK